MNPDLSGPKHRSPQGESAVAVTNHDNTPRGGFRNRGCGQVEQEPIGSVGSKQVWGFNIGGATQFLKGEGRQVHHPSLALYTTLTQVKAQVPWPR